MITIKKYVKELNGKGKPVNHYFEITYTDNRSILRQGIVSFSNKDYEEKRKNDTTTVLQFFTKQAKEQFPVGSDSPNSATEFNTPADIKTELGDNIIET